ncbi:hypothetical protein [Gordonia oryzae]|uniref:hypothetical protein n=1 Tax=Gordonia oryzae TaxID=2487349 RepID=UPI001FE8DDB8|nr:hypothetical protein [Gordonia oryzae]
MGTYAVICSASGMGAAVADSLPMAERVAIGIDRDEPRSGTAARGAERTIVEVSLLGVTELLFAFRLLHLAAGG